MSLRSVFVPSMCLLVGLAAVACSGENAPFRTLSGAVDVNAYPLDNAKVVAHAVDGRQFMAPIQRDGSFRLRLPVGVRYSLAIANSTRQGGLREISLLTWHGSASRTRSVGLAAGANIDLGRIHPVTTAKGGLQTASHGSDDGNAPDMGSSSGNSGDDKDCEDHDDTAVCVDASHDDSECDHDDQDGLDCNDDKTKDGGSSSSGSGGLGALDDGADKEDHGEDHAGDCSMTPAPTTNPPGSTQSTDGGTVGGGGPLASCAVTADCAAGLTCFASQCVSTAL